MPINSNDIEFLVGDESVLSQMSQTPALPAFSPRMIDFLAALSKALLTDRQTKGFVDVISYAYWIRRASIEKAKDKHKDYKNRMGRGVAFHIAPSNVPVNFAVSMTSSALAGNITLIRVSDKKFSQVDIITQAMNSLLDTEFADLKAYFCVIRYTHNAEITEALSAICDVRIIWGGNRTINEIRKAALPPRAIEMAFSDRHSLAIINADEYLKRDPVEVAKQFYTDTYYSDQNACSSPRMVVWTGTKISQAKDLFWEHLERKVIEEYDMKPIQAVDKYASFCSLAMRGGISKAHLGKNYLMRAELEALDSDIMKYKNGGGYFFEYTIEDLKELAPVLTKECQTISVLGIDIDQVKQLVFSLGVRGVDRIVPMGQTMGLEFIWDGYKMIESMSRFVYTWGYEQD